MGFLVLPGDSLLVLDQSLDHAMCRRVELSRGCLEQFFKIALIVVYGDLIGAICEEKVGNAAAVVQQDFLGGTMQLLL